MIALLLLATGCGVGDGSSSAATARWIAGADAICARYGARVAAIPAGVPAVRLPALLAVALPEVAEVARLPVPDGADATAIRAVISARADAVAAITKAAGEALRGTDPTATLRRTKALSDHANALATTLGMHVCGRARQGATNST